MAQGKINWAVIAKVMNIITALVLIGFGIAGIVYMAVNSLTSGKFFLFFSPVFMILFGVMLMAAEFKIQFLIKHFGFLDSYLGRGIFNFYLASSVFYYFSCQSSNTVLAWIAAIIIFVLGLFYCIMHCCGGSGGQQKSQTKQQMM